ncbi:MAG TPA: zinc-binding dehydrogenase [Gemmatimonadaceae bacterium]|nr:zinc-binding dehydrogenase [Gemmatimonadaceae bacterium]
MKAVRYLGARRPFELQNVARREPAAGELLVRVTAAGMCHTELHFRDGLLDLGVAPVTMGHEVVGRVEAVGDGVDASRVGERVIVYYYVGCGACEHCRVGDEHLCAAIKAEYGFVTDGGYAEYVTVPARNAVRLPDSIGDVDAAPIGCGVTTAVHAAKLARLRAGEWAVVYGTGGVGFGLVQLARASGARVIAVGRSAAKLTKARELGAEHVVDASEPATVAARIRELTGGRGADVVFECVGSAESMPIASTALGRRGRLVFIGYSAASFTVHPIQLVVFEQQVMGSVGATLQDLYEAVDLVARGVVRTVVDRTLPLADYQRGLDALEAGELVGRAVLVP